MADLKDNSHKSKEITEKKLEKVASGKVKKKSEVKKFTDVFFAEDFNEVLRYISSDVLIPALKKAFTDTVKNGVDMLVNGERGRLDSRGNASRVSYRSYYDRDDRDRDRGRGYPRTYGGFDYDDILFETMGEAYRFLDALESVIAKYEVASVADFYELADVTNNNYNANKYGWTDIRTAVPERVRDGYIIRMPRPMPID